MSGSIAMDGVKGRFDHFAFGQGRVFVSALGNNTVEVLSIFGGIVEHTITNIPNPQGIAFSPEVHKLFVASAKGKLYIDDADAFNLITTLDFVIVTIGLPDPDQLSTDPYIWMPYVPSSSPKENLRTSQSSSYPRPSSLFNPRYKRNRSICYADEILARHTGKVQCRLLARRQPTGVIDRLESIFRRVFPNLHKVPLLFVAQLVAQQAEGSAL